MRTDFRALCTELVHLNDHPDTDHAKWSEAIDRVRSALATEPKPEGPTDEELLALAASAIEPYQSCGIALNEYEADSGAVEV